MAGYETMTFQLEGTFDGAAARRLRQSLEGVSAQEEVVLDFTQVKLFLDLSISVLTRGLEAKNIRLRGLGTHQERMFRYFGMVAPAPERAYYMPEVQAP